MINRLDLSIIDQVCEMLSSCYKRGISIQPVSVNLSRVDFKVCDIFAEVDAIRRKHKIPTSYLKIEILESTLTTVPDQLRAAMDKFHAASYQDREMYVCSINNFDHYLDKTRRREVKNQRPDRC